MYCPRCGAAEQKGKSYCTRCGEWLPELKSSGEYVGSSPQQYLKVMNIFSGLGMLFSLASAVILFAANFGRGDAHWAVIPAGSLCISVFSWQLTCFILGRLLAKRLRREREDRMSEGRLAGGVHTGQLPDASRFESQVAGARSVTESTTELFEPAARGRER
jgi:hypothetical protein